MSRTSPAGNPTLCSQCRLNENKVICLTVVSDAMEREIVELRDWMKRAVPYIDEMHDIYYEQDSHRKRGECFDLLAEANEVLR